MASNYSGSAEPEPEDTTATTTSTTASYFFNELCTKPLAVDQRPNHIETLLPPLTILVLMLAGTLGLALSNYLHSKKMIRSLKYMQPYLDPSERQEANTPEDSKVKFDNIKTCTTSDIGVIDHILDGDSFYKSFDREVLECIKCYYNQPKRLLRICLPAFISLFLTGAIMLVYQPLASCLWPATAKPDINTAITCFLSPAGLVYALSFGFTFQMVLEKHRRVLKKITSELSMMDQMATMTRKMNLPTPRHEMAIYKAIKSEAVFLAMLVQKREPSKFANKSPRNIKVHIWSVIDILRDAASHPEYNFNLNRILADKMVEYLLQLNDICADRMGTLHSSIHPLKWLFLEVLGGLVLLGIMLIDASSAQMELTMCELTIFSVSMLCYVLADLDSPFNGFFRVDMNVLPQVLARLETLYHDAHIKMVSERLSKG